MKFYLVLALLLWLGQTKAQEVYDDDMVIVEADTGSNRQSRQFVTLPTGLAAGATLLEMGLFRNPTELNHQPCVSPKNEFGQCMTYNECYPERKIFQTEAKDTWIFGLYNTCSYNTPRGKQVFGTCCTRMYPQVPRRTSDNEIPKDKDLSQRKCTPMTTNSKCYYNGRKIVSYSDDDNNNTRIVGGGETSAHEYPFMAALMRVSSYSGTPRQFCGGSLIDESHVLTAAHCIEGLSASDVKTLRVYLGAHDIKLGSRSEHRVIRIIKHKDFDSRTLVNDIAILTLETPANVNSNTIDPVCLPAMRGTFENEMVTVAGWGSKGEGKGQPKELYEVDVRVWSNFQCAAAYNNRIPGKIVDTMICAASNGKDSCSGDSGGPLFMTKSGFRIQLGIVSWGIGCARGDSPGVYTRVTKMMDWIKRIQKCY